MTLPPPTQNLQSTITPSGLIPRKRIDSLYILKAISSFFVVMMHSAFYQREWLLFIIGVGTPCFLSITGYLLYSDSLEREQKKCTKWAFKSFKLGIICATLYLIFYLLLGKSYSITDLLINLVTGDRICLPLWYLTALWEALLLFYLIRTYIPKLIYYLPILFLLSYAIRIHPDIFCPGLGLYGQNLMRSNAIVTALPFLCTGYLIHKHKDFLLSHINVNVWLPVTVMALLGEYSIRVFTHMPFGAFSLLTYPCVIMLILGCVKYPNVNLPIINWIGEKHSANIYYFHIFVLDCICLANITMKNMEALQVWLLCIPISILFNYALNKVPRLFIRETGK